MSRFSDWLDARFPLRNTLKQYASAFYVPKNLNLWYVFGALSLLVLCNQLFTGLWLTMFYTPTTAQAFDSVGYIMRDVPWGWLLRYMHSTGASAFFIVVYLHIFRGLLYGSYQRPRELVWLLGMFLFVLLLLEAFCGYLLPWGQMSYWGAQVITSLLTAIPGIGDKLAIWIRGDFAVSDATLHRFFALHVVGLPMLIIFLVYLHIVAIHQVGSNNPEGIEIYHKLDAKGRPLDGIPFHPFYTTQDLFACAIFAMAFVFVVFFVPDMGGYFLEPDNFTPANPMVTPEHIAPVWYMAPFYAILRVVPDKLGGVIAMAAALILFSFLPWLDKSPVRSMRYKGLLSRLMLALFALCFLILGFAGTRPIGPVTQILALFATLGYFAFFVLMPWYSRYEQHKIPPDRILP